MHRSFTDFLAEKIDKADRLAYHARIVDYYVKRWGGWEARLPSLNDLSRYDELDRYGLRYLAAHLEATGKADDLHNSIVTVRNYVISVNLFMSSNKLIT